MFCQTTFFVEVSTKCDNLFQSALQDRLNAVSSSINLKRLELIKHMFITAGISKREWTMLERLFLVKTREQKIWNNNTASWNVTEELHHCEHVPGSPRLGSQILQFFKPVSVSVCRCHVGTGVGGVDDGAFTWRWRTCFREAPSSTWRWGGVGYSSSVLESQDKGRGPWNIASAEWYRGISFYSCVGIRTGIKVRKWIICWSEDEDV